MSAMEKSLRRALEAGDSSDAAFRESIYTAAERALERMLAGKEMEPEAAHAQRVRLAETINRVEDDYFEPATDADDGSATYADAMPPADGAQEGETEAWHRDDDPQTPPYASDRADDDADFGLQRDTNASPDNGFQAAEATPPPRPTAGQTMSDGADASWSPGGGSRNAKAPKVKGRRFGPFAFGLVVLGIALIAGLAFVYVTVFEPMGGTASSVEAEPDGDTVSAVIASAAGEAEWITLFDGGQLEMIATPNGGEVLSIAGAGDRRAVRISAAAEAGEVDVSIGPGVVNTIKGKKVRVEITVGSADGTPREFGVRCLFGGDTVCGRQRFSTAQDSEAFVFDMVVPDDPAASGTIAIDPSFGAQSNTLDLYAVRLRPDLAA